MTTGHVRGIDALELINKFCLHDHVSGRDEMTDAQREIYEVIDEWWKKFGYGPSIDNIMTMTGDKGRGNVHRKIRSLLRAGHLKGVPNMARSIRPAYLRVYKIEDR
jgi:SOS-response transcriptional repressor LexA